MDSGIILIVVLIIIGFAITWSNQGQVQEIEQNSPSIQEIVKLWLSMTTKVLLKLMKIEIL